MEDAEQAQPRARNRDIEAERERAEGGKNEREEEEERRVQRKEEQRESDIDIIIRQTEVEREVARQALAEGGDLVKVILSLMNEQTETQQTQRGPPRGRQRRGEGKGWDIFPGDFGESAAAGKEASSVPVAHPEKQQQQPVSPAPLFPHPTTPVTVPPQSPTVVCLRPPSKTNSRTVPPTDVLKERLKVALGSIIPPIKVSKREEVLTLGQRGAIGQRSERGGRKRKIRVVRAGAAPSLTLGGESLYFVSVMEGKEGDDRSICTSVLEEAPPLSLAEEEGEGGYIFSEKEGKMVPTGTKRSLEAQKTL
uniref:Uncharacterized protein n=1 Tax=Chromera velia CCMP2878 TaxID=1169474 RepID=A0A0G4EZ15_9ALVE|eukprot:Cvel_14222.t1-p1 / transcript=Cvel_14222.t1 / gene=Cvel_14222 / organism=Chromera_velia_CCMP2878 / gene_product=hypothetical protein / transcript_product=hypothetical protein / location=Cvel_scaffold1003:26695-27615(-) / protein_length=307 / sequence_SO=supercontig / SO=protein_coding / is_pseudo=false